MARIRSIHPGFFADESFVTMSPLARLFWIGLLTEADDQGIFEWKPVTLKIRLMGIENVNVADLLKELADADAIRQFETGDKMFGAIRNFRKFQSPQKPRNIHTLAPGIAEYVGIKKDATGKANGTVPEEYGTPTVRVQEPSGTEGRGEDRDKERKGSHSLRSCDLAQAQAPAPQQNDPPPPAKPKRAKRQVGVYTAIAPDAQPTEAMRAYAEKVGMTPSVFRSEYRRHRDWALKTGKKYADWEAAWRNWCDNWRDRQAATQRSVPKPTAASVLLNINEDFCDESGSSVPFERSSPAYVGGLGECREGISLAPATGGPLNLLDLKPVGSG